jgi:hypothetical protein
VSRLPKNLIDERECFSRGLFIDRQRQQLRTAIRKPQHEAEATMKEHYYLLLFGSVFTSSVRNLEKLPISHWMLHHFSNLAEI